MTRPGASVVLLGLGLVELELVEGDLELALLVRGREHPDLDLRPHVEVARVVYLGLPAPAVRAVGHQQPLAAPLQPEEERAAPGLRERLLPKAGLRRVKPALQPVDPGAELRRVSDKGHLRRA